MEEDTLEVKFVTKIITPGLQVTDKPFRVPVKLGRFGLSGVINHLLELETPKPFDFLVGSDLLRGSLEDYINENNLTLETTLTIEYIEALNEPKHDSSFKHDDWVACIDALYTQDYFITGSYDNVVRVFDSPAAGVADAKPLITCSGHDNGITGISNFYEGKSVLGFVSSSKDCTLRVWKANKAEKTAASTHVCKGHSASVECVDMAPQSIVLQEGGEARPIQFCSGSWDHTIRIWNIEAEDGNFGDQISGKKKRKMESKEVESVSVLEGHHGCVSSVSWISDSEIISGSWDHSVKLWDIGRSADVTTLNGGEVIYSLSYSPFHRLVATGHSDRKIRTWDIRSSSSKVVAQLYSSHTGFVTSVAWHPTKEFLFVSASHDKTVKVWDMRAKIPLHTIQAHEDKALTVKWQISGGVHHILSGGADTKVNRYTVDLGNEQQQQE